MGCAASTCRSRPCLPGQRHHAAGHLHRPVARVGPQLGQDLDPARVQVTFVPSQADAHGAAASEAITLTGSVDAKRDRLLLVHELVHARQHRNRGAAKPDVTAAEAEAAGIANAAREGRTLWVPRQALPDAHVAHDVGASGVAADTTASTPDVAALEQTLDQLVGANHTGDKQFITGQLDHPWTQTTEDMIENCLRALSALRFVVARVLVRSLDRAVRLRLALLRDSHHAQYPEQCVAVLSALSEKELAALAQQRIRQETYPGATAALHGVDPSRLSDTAHRALLATLRRLPVTTLTTLENGDRRDVFRGFLKSGPDTGTDEAELQAAIDAETASPKQAGGGNDASLVAVREALRDPSAENAQRALRRLKSLCDKAKRAEQTAPEKLPALTKPTTSAASGGALRHRRKQAATHRPRPATVANSSPPSRSSTPRA